MFITDYKKGMYILLFFSQQGSSQNNKTDEMTLNEDKSVIFKPQPLIHSKLQISTKDNQFKIISFSISKNMHSAKQNSAMTMDQNSIMQMNAMADLRGATGVMGLAMGDPRYFHFKGLSHSLQTRLDNMTTEADNYIDANITVNGVEVKPMRHCIRLLTLYLFCLIFPIFFFWMNWWKRYTYPAYSMHKSVYVSLGKIIHGANIGNVTLYVRDNTFNQQKAQILYNHLLGSPIKTFTLQNYAYDYDFQQNEFSNFIENMKPIKTLTKVTSLLRWYAQIVPN